MGVVHRLSAVLSPRAICEGEMSAWVDLPLRIEALEEECARLRLLVAAYRQDAIRRGEDPFKWEIALAITEAVNEPA